MSKDDNDERSSLEGLGWPLSLSAAILITSTGYLMWKLWHPRESSDWAAGDAAAMVKAVSLADAGQFLSGVTGALVFIWIIFTYRAQREELAFQRQEMQAQRKEFEKLAGEAQAQSKLLEQTAAMNKRDAFIRYLAMRERELAMGTADFLRTVSRHIMALNQLERAWNEYEKGDHHVFFRTVMSRLVRGEHHAFLEEVRRTMGAEDTIEWLREQAEVIVDSAREVDVEMERICKATPWYRMALQFDQLLGPSMGSDALS